MYTSGKNKHDKVPQSLQVNCDVIPTHFLLIDTIFHLKTADASEPFDPDDQIVYDPSHSDTTTSPNLVRKTVFIKDLYNYCITHNIKCYEFVKDMSAKEIWTGTKDYIKCLNHWPKFRKATDKNSLEKAIAVGKWLGAEEEYLELLKKSLGALLYLPRWVFSHGNVPELHRTISFFLSQMFQSIAVQSLSSSCG
jgi:hypothetical protein